MKQTNEGITLTDNILKNITLDVEGWLDSPQPVIAEIMAGQSENIVIDASTASSVPAQIAQLLIAARRSALANGGSLEIHQPSEAVKRSLSLLGLADHLLSDAP